MESRATQPYKPLIGLLVSQSATSWLKGIFYVSNMHYNVIALPPPLVFLFLSPVGRAFFLPLTMIMIIIIVAMLKGFAIRS